MPGMGPPSGKQQPRQTWRAALLCCFYCLGTTATLLVYGLWQEKIMARPYHIGADFREYLAAFSSEAVPTSNPAAWPTMGDYFQSSLLLVLISRLFGLAFALVMMMTSREPFGWQASLWQYLLVSITTVLASACQFEALKYTVFTLQILGKSFKNLPMMCWGMVIMGKSYRALDWTAGIFFCGGVLAYMLEGQIQPEHSDGGALWGIWLLVGFIALDGITSSYQDRLFVDGSSSKYNKMLYINAFSAMLAGLILLVRGEVGPTISFCTSHPLVLLDASIMSTSAVLAQWFVYATVHSFGTALFMVTMNVRQIVSVVASILVYHHHVTHIQVAALAVCCAALLGQVMGGFCSASTSEQTPLMSDGKAKAEDSGKPAVMLTPKLLAQSCVPCVGRDRQSQV